MAGLYPSLQEKFRSESVCPICMIEIGSAKRYSCINSHTICNRCNQFYHACPFCLLPLIMEPEFPNFTPMPMPSFDLHPYPATAPAQDFIEQEKRNSHGELLDCPYSLQGCWVKFPKKLEEIHVSRCQFRPNLEENRQPTDIHHNIHDLVDCHFTNSGCRVRIPIWRRKVHERRCQYGDSTEDLVQQLGDLGFAALFDCKYKDYGCNAQLKVHQRRDHEDNCVYRFNLPPDRPVYTVDDENTAVECRFKEHGCKVRVFLKSLMNHESVCPYNKYDLSVGASESVEESEIEWHSRILAACKYKELGCIVTIPFDKKEFHEERCMFRNREGGYENFDELVNCRFWYKGCKVRMPSHLKSTHEEKCNYH